MPSWRQTRHVQARTANHSHLLFPEMWGGESGWAVSEMCKQGLSVSKQILLGCLLALLSRDSVQPLGGALVTSILLWHHSSSPPLSFVPSARPLPSSCTLNMMLWRSRGELVTPPSVLVPSRSASSSILWE